MSDVPGILVAKGAGPLELLPRYANRHGLIAGATGTGKTVTLQVLAEGFSLAGVPVFVADVKGDLAGLSQAGAAKPKIVERLAALGLADHGYRGFPVVCWDLFGEAGHPVRATISDLGPLLLARLLDLNEVQAGVLNLVFKVADDRGLLLLDLKDLRAMLTHVGDHARDLVTDYGNVSAASIGAIQRALLQLEQQGADRFFGEPALALDDLMLTDPAGLGAIGILVADKLMQSPRAYATFLLWLLSELFENLPEAGDLPKPKLVFFFDEAHLLFDEAPKALVDKVEQVVRLIRSRGVGVWFVTQNPLDIPDTVSGQLGNRVQHALRAFTPREQRAVRAAAETFRMNPALDTEKAIIELGVGEALVSLLEPSGAPGIVERALVCPPRSRIGTITAEERAAILAASPVKDVYDRTVDRESAYERLGGERPGTRPWGEGERSEDDGARGEGTGAGPTPDPAPRRRSGTAPAGGVLDGILRGRGRRESVAESLAKSVSRSIGSQLGRQIVRGVLGSIMKK